MTDSMQVESGIKLQVLTGDCIERIKEIPDNHVHCIVTSPPYWPLIRDYGAGQIGDEATEKEHLAKILELTKELHRILHPSGAFWMNYGDSYVKTTEDKKRTRLRKKSLIGMPWKVAIAIQQQRLFVLRRDIIWHKIGILPEMVSDRPSNEHEMLFMFTKGKCFYNKSHAAVKSKKADFHIPLRTVWPISFQGKLVKASHQSSYPIELVCICIGLTTPNAVCDKCGEPQKLEILKTFVSTGEQKKRFDKRDPLIAHHNRNKDIRQQGGWRFDGNIFHDPECECVGKKLRRPIVFDPFLGSGTTAFAAAAMSRDAIGCEINIKNINIAEKAIRSRYGLFAQLEIR